MFEWLDMIGNYEQRKVANFKNDIFEIDTAYVTDRTQPYETAIRHKNFNYNNWIVLGWSSTKEQAQEDHDKWIERFLNSPYPEKITDAYDDIDYYKLEDK